MIAEPLSASGIHAITCIVVVEYTVTCGGGTTGGDCGGLRLAGVSIGVVPDRIITPVAVFRFDAEARRYAAGRAPRERGEVLVPEVARPDGHGALDAPAVVEHEHTRQDDACGEEAQPASLRQVPRAIGIVPSGRARTASAIHRANVYVPSRTSADRGDSQLQQAPASLRADQNAREVDHVLDGLRDLL